MNIKLDLYLIISILILFLFRQAENFLIFYFFVFLHELAHILVAFLLKIKVEEISFLPVGVNAKFHFENHRIKEILIACAGPVFSLIAAILFTDYKIENSFILIMNLLPIYPLDGGRILKNGIILLVGVEKGIEVYNSLLRIFVILLLIFNIIQVVFLKNFSILFSSLYILQIVKEEIKKDKLRRVMKSLLNVEI